MTDWEESSVPTPRKPQVLLFMYSLCVCLQIQLQQWKGTLPPTGPRPLCWRPGWGVWSRPPNASPRAVRSCTSTRPRFTPSSPWWWPAAVRHSARCHRPSTTPSTPRWPPRLNASKGEASRDHLREPKWTLGQKLPSTWLIIRKRDDRLINTLLIHWRKLRCCYQQL